ncbi:MAG: phospholipase D-like domain-containing protein [Alkalilacustris sp.]
MTLLMWLLGLAVLFAVASYLALYSYGRFARQAKGAVSHMLPVAEAATAYDRALAPLEAAHPGQSGLACAFDNATAFGLRLASLRAAGRSVDLASYIWRDDLTGRLMARELLAAADRGVRVRLLLDDVNVQGFDPKFRALNGHPGIEVRLFNPVRNRRTAVRRGIEMLLMAVRFNRRMHAKLWIVDGRIAITGGRNIGNEYFGVPSARKRRVRDADIVLAGPLVREAGALFDGYWNSDQALPIAAFWRDYEAGLERFRERLEESARRGSARRLLRDSGAVLPPAGEAPLPAGLRWSASARLVADPPDKALGRGRDAWMPAVLVPTLRSARQRLRLVTPYFVPGQEGMAELRALAAEGVTVEVVTNGLAVTNHLVVHGAYRRYRRPLLAAGVRLREFAPADGPGPEGRAEMLHSKAFVVDGRLGFIGSFNFDLRSAWLNIEAGVLFEDPAIIAELEAEIDRCTGPEVTYALRLEEGRLHWSEGPERGTPAPLCHDPAANALRRGASWAIGHLPIHTHL